MSLTNIGDDPGDDIGPNSNHVDDEDETALLSLGSTPQVVIPKIPGCISARYTLVFLAFLGFFNVYLMRINLSVAMVAMVDYTPHLNITPIAHNECPGVVNTNDSTSKSTAETFAWDEDTQNHILSSFFAGYVITQIPGGWLAGRYGGKWIYGLGILCTSVLTLLTPLAAMSGVGWFVALRVLEGIGEGVTFPAIYAMMALWAPPYERTKMLLITTSGSIMGTICGNAVAGVLCDSNFMQGWPSVFYLSGALGIIWFVFWALLIHETPLKHPRISQEEREYIIRSIGPKQVTTLYVPFYSMLTSVPVWGIIIPSFCTAWGGYTVLVDLPNYLKNVLKFDITQSGFISSLPFLLNWFTYIGGAFIADFLRKNGYLSTIATRKIFQSGYLISAVTTAMVPLVGCNQLLGVTFLCLAAVGFGFGNSGAGVNQLDIAPKYAGVLFGITNTVGASTGFFAPTVVGLLTEGNNTIEQWRIVFWICSGLYLVGFLSFVLMGSGEEQAWAKTAVYSPVADGNDSNTAQISDKNSINPDNGLCNDR